MHDHDIRDEFLHSVAEEAAFTGFSEEAVQAARQALNIEYESYKAMFPAGQHDIARAFSEMIDRKMLQALKASKLTPMRIRDKIAFAVETRLDILSPYEDMVRGCARYWSFTSPDQAASTLWRSADIIWNWAGDDSQDYNYYTKRGLLSGVILSTTLYWLNDHSDEKCQSSAFLRRRIDNVLKIGKTIGKPLKTVMSFAQKIKPQGTNKGYNHNE